MAAAAAATRGGPGNVQGLVKQAEQRLSLDTTTSPSRKWTAFDDTHLPSKPSLEIEVPIAHKPPTGRFAKQLSLSDMELSDSEEVCLVSPFGLSPSGQPPRTLISQFSQSYGTSPTPSWSWGWGRLPVKADSKARSLHFVTLFFWYLAHHFFAVFQKGSHSPQSGQSQHTFQAAMNLAAQKGFDLEIPDEYLFFSSSSSTGCLPHEPIPGE